MTEPTEPTPSGLPTEDPEATQTQVAVKKRHFRRTRRVFAPVGHVLAKIPHPPWGSKRGIFVLVVMLGGFGLVVGVGGMTALSFSETSSFCGLCHVMDPQLKAYAVSPHKDVACAECHIFPGVGGFVKAKSNGTLELIELIRHKYPMPIPAADHAKMPPVQVSCLKCHSLKDITENGGPVKLILRPRYRLDESNTRDTVAVMIRPAGLGDASGVLGVHWHVQQTVTYTTSEVNSSKIDLVSMKAKDGTTQQYIAASQVAVSSDVTADLTRLKLGETTKTMDCIDCHNRIGHEVPSPDQAIDQAMADGKISPTLPFIKRDGLALLNGDFASDQAADTAIDGLRTSYAAHYPLVTKDKGAQITSAIDELKAEYNLISTPAMKVMAKTYPNNLGHQSSPGCFRCHDGAHFLVVKGKLTNKAIPSACATCHSFPQVSANADMFPLTKPASTTMGSALASIAVGTKPADHKDKLYVFNHKHAVSSVDPTGKSCAACHTPSYCQNCHDSGAIKVKHDGMLFNHAKSAAAAGGVQSCNYCHLPVFCAQCHKGPVVGDNSLMPSLKAAPVAAITPKTTR